LKSELDVDDYMCVVSSQKQNNKWDYHSYTSRRLST